MTRIDINRILRNENRTKRSGAPLGRSNQHDPEAGKLHLQRINFIDGDYAPCGTYWGSGGDPLYCAFTPDLASEIYVRARSREAARAEILDNYEFAEFIQ